MKKIVKSVLLERMIRFIEVKHMREVRLKMECDTKSNEIE